MGGDSAILILGLGQTLLELGKVLLDWMSQKELGLVWGLFLLEALSLPMLSDSL